MSQVQAANQVLEFTLGAESYCISIDHVNEIVSNEHDFTRIPNSAPHIEGITDLRGQTATVINPRTVLGIDEGGDAENIVIFKSEDDASFVGWLVDEVSQVIDLSNEDVDESIDEEYVRGVVKRDGKFLVWVEPDIINASNRD